ncbi:DNA-processing protein DprA [Helicobacter sp. UBA3407]|uniref:DNA-processing protein DprA n=1 Tax=Helicobacter TaxID=209 RepID=UPI00261AC32B|nr:DNA-processing protein DprA [Helicobacter sp. UBA3407]
MDTTKYSQNVLNILAALKCKGIGRAWIIDNYQPNIPLEELSKKLREKDGGFDFFSTMKEVQEVLDNSKEDIKYTALGDEDFPTNRFAPQMKKKDFPVFLAYEGDLKLLSRDNFNIAVIGLLEPTLEIQALEKAILKEILECNATIVSGLALGCDSIAHESVSNQDCTIAVLPSTLDKILPKENRELANEIVNNKNGLLISEYYEEAKNTYDLVGRYIERDRLQALFSDMVILTASYSEQDSKRDKRKDSGSRHAMNKAREYGIKRAVMYDRAIFDDERFNLNRELIAMEARNGKLRLDEASILDFNKSEANRDFKIISKRNAKSIIESLKKWKNKQGKKCLIV